MGQIELNGSDAPNPYPIYLLNGWETPNPHPLQINLTLTTLTHIAIESYWRPVNPHNPHPNLNLLTRIFKVLTTTKILN